jgi:putative photosynthetic complex assembly protein
MSAHVQKDVPRGAIIGAGVLISIVMAAVGAAQLDKHYNPPPAPTIDESQIAAVRDLKFIEGATGVTVVYDAQSGQQLEKLRENDGFIRTVLASMAFDRSRQKIEEVPVYRLVRWKDGRVSLQDMTVGRKINLGAFGGPNKAVFERFLPSGETGQEASP